MTAGNQPSSSASDGLWLIVKRGLYFRPDCKGYTGIKDEAGRYKLDFAKDYDRGECKIVREEDGPEFMPAAYNDLVIQHLTKQRDEARAELARVRGAAQRASVPDAINAACDAIAAAQPPRTPPDLSASELNTLATDAFKEAAQGSAVAWTGEYDGHLDTTIYRDTMERWKALGRKITPLYAVTPSPGARAWTTDQFWEYVGAMAGEFEAGQMRDMLAAKGLSIPSTTRDTPRAPLNAIQFITLLEILEECAEHVTPELEARIKNVLGYHTDHDTVSSLPPATSATAAGDAT